MASLSRHASSAGRRSLGPQIPALSGHRCPPTMLASLPRTSMGHAVLLLHSVSSPSDIPIWELITHHPAKNNSPHFMCLREPILQPFSFQIHAGMGGTPPFYFDTYFIASRNGNTLPAAMGAAAKRAYRLQERRSCRPSYGRQEQPG